MRFRTKTGTYKKVKDARTGSGGYVTTTVTAGSDGYWRLRFGGNSISGGATSAADFVDVK